MNERNRLYNYVIEDVYQSSQGECSVAHLNYGKSMTPVAITPEGLKEHNDHNFMNNIAIGGTVGLLLFPIFGVGGFGLVSGTAYAGVSAAEVALAGGALGFGGSALTSTATEMHGHKATKTTKDCESISLVNMIGFIKSRQLRWWGQPGYDVEITWKALDQNGNMVTSTAWHDPEHLVQMKFIK